MFRAKEDSFATPTKKLRFRGDLNFPSRVDDLFDDDMKRGGAGHNAGKGASAGAKQNEEDKEQNEKGEESPSFMDFFKMELTRGYMI